MFLLSSNSGISLLHVSITLSTKITRKVTGIWNMLVKKLYFLIHS